MTSELATFAKPIAAVGMAGLTYLAETVTPDIPGVPVWLTSLGFPIAMLVAVIYALVATNKALRDSQAARIKDMETTAAKLEGIIDRGHESRERLIRATDQQTAEIKNLVERIK